MDAKLMMRPVPLDSMCLSWCCWTKDAQDVELEHLAKVFRFEISEQGRIV